jgi:hypothetical protein
MTSGRILGLGTAALALLATAGVAYVRFERNNAPVGAKTMVALAIAPQARVMAMRSAKIIRMFAPMAATPRVPLVSALRSYAASLARHGALEELAMGTSPTSLWIVALHVGVKERGRRRMGGVLCKVRTRGGAGPGCNQAASEWAGNVNWKTAPVGELALAHKRPP